MQLKKTEFQGRRDSSIELLRIVLMMLIVSHHYVFNSGLFNLINLQRDSVSMANCYFLLLGAWGKFGINCFVLITGYFMCKSEISTRRFFKVYGLVLFYGLLINLSLLLMGRIDFSWKVIFDSLIPICDINVGFVGGYLVLLVLIPYLNVLVRNLSRCSYQVLLLLLFVLYSAFSVFHATRMDVNYVSWFCTVYLAGAYMRTYPAVWMNNQRLILLLLLCGIIAGCGSVLAFEYLTTNGFAYFLLHDCNKPFAICLSVIAFLFFRNMALKYSPVINWVSSTMFAVFLIHAYCPGMRDMLWNDIFNVCSWHLKWWAPIGSAVVVVAVMIGGVVIDSIRKVILNVIRSCCVATRG